ncbi:hypothetical protein MMC16_004978 [Acarospora aff. strigata]|nr:hypothetical protein [Acarospora aff. strigata]
MTHIFISRAELLPGGETTGDHKRWQGEETELVERDRNNLDRSTGGLFRGSFKSPGLSFRAIRDDQDGVVRCPRCLWELEDGVCLRCLAGVEDANTIPEDFSELEDRSDSEYDASEDDMDLEIDMEDQDGDIDPDLWTQDDGDISLDGNGRPIHMGGEFSDGGWGLERASARNTGGHSRAQGGSRRREGPAWEHGSPDEYDALSTSGSEGEGDGEDEEAGSLDDFIVNELDERYDGQINRHSSSSMGHRRLNGFSNTIARSARNTDRGWPIASLSADHGRGREDVTPDTQPLPGESMTQLSDDEDSDEGGGISNGRRRVRPGRSQPSGRVVSRHGPGGFPILSDGDDEVDSDGATDTLLQAGWSQLDQDDTGHDETRAGGLGVEHCPINNANMRRSTSTESIRPVATSSRSARRRPGQRNERRRRDSSAEGRSNYTRQPPSGSAHAVRDLDMSNSDFTPRVSAWYAAQARDRRAPSLGLTEVDEDHLSTTPTDKDQGSDHDPGLFSPLSSSSSTTTSNSRTPARDLSEMHYCSLDDPDESESGGTETPSGSSPQFGNRASSETATIGRDSPAASSSAASHSSATHVGALSPIYINSSPIKSEVTPSPVDRTSMSLQSPTSNHTTHRHHRLSPGANPVPYRISNGRIRAVNARHDLSTRLSRPTIRGGGPPSTSASLFPHPRQSTTDPEDRDAAKNARRRAKESRRQQQHTNPFSSAQSRLSRASELLNEAADRYSDMQGQPSSGTSHRAENVPPSAGWGVVPDSEDQDQDDDMW